MENLPPDCCTQDPAHHIFLYQPPPTVLICSQEHCQVLQLTVGWNFPEHQGDLREPIGNLPKHFNTKPSNKMYSVSQPAQSYRHGNLGPCQTGTSPTNQPVQKVHYTRWTLGSRLHSGEPPPFLFRKPNHQGAPSRPSNPHTTQHPS